MFLNNTIFVSSVTKLVSCLNARSGPALTVYSAERVELGGPVAARWITKIANYLQGEAGAPLFGDEEPHPARLHTRIEPWQQVLWEVTARCLGWEILDTPRPLPGDVVVGADTDGLLTRAAAAGAHALAQPAAHLAFAWNGPLPQGVLDALQEIGAQSDVPDHPSPDLVEAVLNEALAGSRPRPEPTGDRVALLWNARRGPTQVLDQWARGRSVVVIDPAHYKPADTHALLAAEGMEGSITIYMPSNP
mgnify:CR=1 FL=1